MRLVLRLALVLVLMSPAAARAQDQFSVEVTPLRVELRLGPGATHTQVVTLKNESKTGARIRARIDDWFLSKDGTPQFKAADPADSYSAASWVRLNPPEQLVAPGGTAVVRFTTVVPKDAKEGGYRCAVMFEFEPPDGDVVAKARAVLFRGRVATLLYATVGTPLAAVELTDLQVRTAANRPADVVATLRNTSRTHVRTNGTLVISDSDGHVVRRVPVPNVPVLPESEREVSVPTAQENEAPLPPGTYRAEVRIDVGQPAIIVGETTFVIAPR